jgi:hypothetical protein
VCWNSKTRPKYKCIRCEKQYCSSACRARDKTFHVAYCNTTFRQRVMKTTHPFPNGIGRCVNLAGGIELFLNNHSEQCKIECTHCIFCKKSGLVPFQHTACSRDTRIYVFYYKCYDCYNLSLCTHSFTSTRQCRFRASQLAKSFYAYQMAVKRKCQRPMCGELRYMLWKAVMKLKPCGCV